MREAAGIKQTELAQRLNKPQSYVAKVENFDRRLDVVELVDWAGGLGVPPAKVLGRLGWW